MRAPACLLSTFFCPLSNKFSALLPPTYVDDDDDYAKKFFLACFRIKSVWETGIENHKLI